MLDKKEEPKAETDFVENITMQQGKGDWQKWERYKELNKKLYTENLSLTEWQELLKIEQEINQALKTPAQRVEELLEKAKNGEKLTDEELKELYGLLIKKYKAWQLTYAHNTTFAAQLQDLIAQLQNAISEIGGKVPYGSTKCAEMVQNFRKKIQANTDKNAENLETGLALIPMNTSFDVMEQKAWQKANFNTTTEFKAFHARNIAVVAYVDAEGILFYKMAVSSPASKQHAENVLLEDLKNDKIPYSNVKEWYTELQPCNAPLHSCRDSLVKLTPDAKVTYTFNYDHDKKNVPLKHEVKEWENFVKTKKFNE